MKTNKCIPRKKPSYSQWVYLSKGRMEQSSQTESREVLKTLGEIEDKIDEALQERGIRIYGRSASGSANDGQTSTNTSESFYHLKNATVAMYRKDTYNITNVPCPPVFYDLNVYIYADTSRKAREISKRIQSLDSRLVKYEE